MGRARRGIATARADGGSSDRFGTWRRPWRWSDGRLRAELERFCREGAYTTFPTQRQFDQAGRADLRHAVRVYGGTVYWAKQIGLPLASRQDREPYTSDDAIRDASEVVAELGYLPGVPVLRRMGRNRLATAVQRAGGAARFGRQHGLTRPEDGDPGAGTD